MMTNAANRVLYTGVTSDLKKRAYQHREGLLPGFTKKYNVKELVYYESCNDILNAIAREKMIKGWLRRKKIGLIDSFNPGWRDLYDEI